jgi:dihydroxyacid dehydratase/phosphogluconate dehydratase
MRSDAMKKGLERAPHRSLFKAMGYTDEELARPFIGIANSANGDQDGRSNPLGVRHHRDLRRYRHGT